MAKAEVLIVGGARTPMTDYVGALKDVSALALGAIAARGAFTRSGVKPEWIDHTVIARPESRPRNVNGGAIGSVIRWRRLAHGCC